MHYQTVFDVATAGYRNWDFPASGLIGIACGAFLIAGWKRFPGHPIASKVFAYFCLVFSVLWTLGAFESTYGDYESLSHAESLGNLKVAEGVVTDFSPMFASGHKVERFCVSGACFDYSDYVITGGFNNTSSHGGPIREGLRVRVSYVGNNIVKLEVAD